MTRRPSSPGLALYLSEPGRAVADYGLYLATRPLLPHLPRGDGHPVLVLPGLLADDGSTRVLRRALSRLGYQVHGWRLGRNMGPSLARNLLLRRRLATLASRHGRPVTLIGWSLGGLYARDLARRSPRAVRQVITLGTPFRLQPRNRKLSVPSTSIYSQLDGIVPWRACLHTPGARTENIAVLASHLGLGHHPAALWAIADRLSQPRRGWTPFRPPWWLRPAFPAPAT